jgi:ElaB/YqjD/DUF883 family membrane-anchored ribosome-binding protein
MAQTRARDSDNPTTDRLASMAHDTIDRVAETANYAEREVRDAAARGAEQARHVQDQAKEVADENLHKVRSFLEENPLMGAGIAFVAGIVLSSLIRR